MIHSFTTLYGMASLLKKYLSDVHLEVRSNPRFNFINILLANFFVWTCFAQLFSTYVLVLKLFSANILARKYICAKGPSKYVDEIDTSSASRSAFHYGVCGNKLLIHLHSIRLDINDIVLDYTLNTQFAWLQNIWILFSKCIM